MVSTGEPPEPILSSGRMFRNIHPFPKTAGQAERVGGLIANVKGEELRFGHMFRNGQPIEIVGRP
jgi:hypothetical protein